MADYMGDAGTVGRVPTTISRDVGDQCIVYDTTTDQAHLLSDAAAVVWRSLEQPAPVAELDRQLVGLGHEPVADALVELDTVGLLHRTAPRPSRAQQDRRQALLRIGAAAVLTPSILTILAPTPAAAASGGDVQGLSLPEQAAEQAHDATDGRGPFSRGGQPIDERPTVGEICLPSHGCQEPYECRPVDPNTDTHFCTDPAIDQSGTAQGPQNEGAITTDVVPEDPVTTNVAPVEEVPPGTDESTSDGSVPDATGSDTSSQGDPVMTDGG